MKEKSNDARTARIDALANDIIADAKAREAERCRHNEEEMEKLKRWLASKSKMTPSVSQPVGGLQCNR